MVVSHDRGFIGRVANRILEIRNGHVEPYPGTYDEYVWSLSKGVLSERGEAAAQKIDTAKQEAPKFNFKEASKQLQGVIKEQQRRILKCEELLAQKEKERDRLTHELLSAQGAQAATLAKDLNTCGKEIERLEEDIFRHMELQEEKERELLALRQK